MSDTQRTLNYNRLFELLTFEGEFLFRSNLRWDTLT